ncbi:hypothetical protein V7S43_015835 [Phytophthora oleae]|uniref:Protein kinase domain-containing protein n=1 Tax=Phytophthora oleae TaxID=2107226 RepID=A0ABD3EZX6_9STRA
MDGKNYEIRPKSDAFTQSRRSEAFAGANRQVRHVFPHGSRASEDLETVVRELSHKDLTEWRDDWESDRSKHRRTLTSLLEEASGGQLRVELAQEIVVQEVVGTLKKELRSKRLSKDQLKLMELTWTRIENLEQVKNAELVNWFISMSDLVLDDAPIAVGSFGQVYRATWYHDGEVQKVVVKRLLTETTGASRDTLVSLLTAWHEQLLHKSTASHPTFIRWVYA